MSKRYFAMVMKETDLGEETEYICAGETNKQLVIGAAREFIKEAKESGLIEIVKTVYCADYSDLGSGAFWKWDNPEFMKNYKVNLNGGNVALVSAPSFKKARDWAFAEFGRHMEPRVSSATEEDYAWITSMGGIVHEIV